MNKILMISPEKCLGCRSCELVCSFNRTNEFNPKLSAISVSTYDEAGISVPLMCMQCEDPACVKVCPVNAISRDENGAVVIDDKKCIVCKMCMSACPLGNISLNPVTRKLIKCNLCGGSPKCEQICPAGALQFKEGTSANINRKKMIAAKFKDLFGEADA